MKCDDCLQLLESYLDRELDNKTRTRVSEHLSTCDSCLHEYRSLENQQAFFIEHSPAVEPSPAFWSGVTRDTKRLNEERHGFARFLRPITGFRIGPALTAAIIVCTVAGTITLMHVMNRERTTEPLQASSVAGTPTVASHTASEVAIKSESLRHVVETRRAARAVASRVRRLPESERVAHQTQSPDDLVRDAEKKYLAAIAMLSRDAGKRRSTTDPDQLIQFDQALATVDRTIAGTRRAVREHPTDPVAVQYMLAAYAKKVDVLRQMLTD